MLGNMAFGLAREASELYSLLRPVVRLAVADMLRSMNGYHSNLIDGQDTHHRDNEGAPVAECSSHPYCRDL